MVSTKANVTFTRRSQEKHTMFFSFPDPPLYTKILNIPLHHLQVDVDTRNEDTDAGTTQEVVGSVSKSNGKLRRQPVDIKAVQQCICC